MLPTYNPASCPSHRPFKNWKDRHGQGRNFLLECQLDDSIHIPMQYHPNDVRTEQLWYQRFAKSWEKTLSTATLWNFMLFGYPYKRKVMRLTKRGFNQQSDKNHNPNPPDLQVTRKSLNNLLKGRVQMSSTRIQILSKIAGIVMVILQIIPGNCFGEASPEVVYPAIGDSPMMVQVKMGHPIAKAPIESRINSFALKYAKRYPDYTLSVQVVYMDERVVHMTVHRVSIDGTSNVSWDEKSLKSLRTAINKDDIWERINTKDKDHIWFGPMIIYAPQEIHAIKTDGEKSWIVFHHIPQVDIVQIMHTGFYEPKQTE